MFAGQEASFAVEAAGVAPLSYSWRFNGSPVAGANALGADTTLLSLRGVITNQAGRYWVVVTNLAGASTSAVAGVAQSGLGLVSMGCAHPACRLCKIARRCGL